MDYKSANFDTINIPPHSAGEVYVSDDVVSLPVTLADDEIAGVGTLPAGCVPIDVKAICDELDANATDTLTFSVGILNDDGDDLVTASTFITGATADATINFADSNSAGAMGVAEDKEEDQILAVKITNVAATKKAGDVRVIMTYRASNYGA